MSTTLYRSKTNRVIAGVAGGLGEYFNVDPIIIRILLIILAATGGTGIFVYIVLWLVLPEQKEDLKEVPVHPKIESLKKRRDSTLAFILITLGVILLINQFAPHFRIMEYWPLILIAIGIGILLK